MTFRYTVLQLYSASALIPSLVVMAGLDTLGLEGCGVYFHAYALSTPVLRLTNIYRYNSFRSSVVQLLPFRSHLKFHRPAGIPLLPTVRRLRICQSTPEA